MTVNIFTVACVAMYGMSHFEVKYFCKFQHNNKLTALGVYVLFHNKLYGQQVPLCFGFIDQVFEITGRLVFKQGIQD